MTVVGAAHAIDQGERQLGAGFPRVERGVPFVRATGAEVVEEGSEGGEETSRRRLGLESFHETADACIERSVDRRLGCGDTAEFPHLDRRCRAVDAAEAGKELDGERSIIEQLLAEVREYGNGDAGSKADLEMSGEQCFEEVHELLGEVEEVVVSGIEWWERSQIAIDGGLVLGQLGDGLGSQQLDHISQAGE